MLDLLFVSSVRWLREASQPPRGLFISYTYAKRPFGAFLIFSTRYLLWQYANEDAQRLEAAVRVEATLRTHALADDQIGL